MNKGIGFRFGMLLVSIAIFSLDSYQRLLSPLSVGSQANETVPILLWNTFLGTSNSETRGTTVATDAAGNVYVGGTANASWASPIRPYSGGGDAFVAKLDGSGRLVWLTYLGGTGNDFVSSLAVDRTGGIFAAGTSSAQWGTPVRPYSNAKDAFVAKVASDGSLLWHTFLGGNADDEATGVVVDGTGKAIVVGWSGGPAWGAPLRPREGNTDAFVAIIDGQGALEANTFLGGTGEDRALGISQGIDQNLYVTGSSTAMWGAPVTPFIGPGDLFAAKLTAGGALVWNTFRGIASYSGSEGFSVAVDGQGRTYVGGNTSVYYAVENIDYSGFILALSSSGAARWETSVGAGAIKTNVLLEEDGNVVVGSGYGRSSHGMYFNDSHIFKLSPTGTILWNYLLGPRYDPVYGSCWIYLHGLALDEKGKIDAVGYCKKTWGDPINPFAGYEDAFFAEIAEPFKLGSPNGGESWAAGVSQNIQWRTEGSISSVKLEYSRDGGSSWNPIAVASPNDGSYEWLVPKTPSTQCLVRISDASNPVSNDRSDAVFSIIISPSPVIGLSPGELRFGASGGTTTGPLPLLIDNLGGGTLSWTSASDRQWLVLDPAAGSGPGQIVVRVIPGDLPSGSYNAHLTITAPDALNSPKSISVSLNVNADGATQPPFGHFDAPNNSATISSSIAVTGWALDDIEATGVKIYRDPVGTEPAGSRIYIGDATFVEGARPDVELAFPSYPLNDRAGWGYMMLTNFLPNSGNGTFTIYAYATDREGHEVQLGSKTITCDNANAVKPFGAIDLPAQGETISGTAYINGGWALTPPPNVIPIDGSTLMLWVDGLPIGRPSYNHFRGDIAALFPGYANSNGAVGVFTLDTTGYSNGIHTIAWSVRDNAGNEDGIGSRYFSILNSGIPTPRSEASSHGPLTTLSDLSDFKDVTLPFSYTRKGFDRSLPPDRVFQASSFAIPKPGEGPFLVIRALERLEILLDDIAWATDAERRTAEKAGHTSAHIKTSIRRSGSRWRGYLIVGKDLRPLPVGSNLDTSAGIFSWLPGPCFLGDYRLVFVDSENRSSVFVSVRIRS